MSIFTPCLSNSALGAWSKIFNPRLQVFKFQKNPHDWFPANKILFYKSNNITINNQLIELQ